MLSSCSLENCRQGRLFQKCGYKADSARREKEETIRRQLRVCVEEAEGNREHSKMTARCQICMDGVAAPKRKMRKHEE